MPQIILYILTIFISMVFGYCQAGNHYGQSDVEVQAAGLSYTYTIRQMQYGIGDALAFDTLVGGSAIQLSGDGTVFTVLLEGKYEVKLPTLHNYAGIPSDVELLLLPPSGVSKVENIINIGSQKDGTGKISFTISNSSDFPIGTIVQFLSQGPDIEPSGTNNTLTITPSL